MVVTHKVYSPAIKNILNGTIDLVGDTIKVALMKDAFSFDQSSENWVNTHECDDDDYLNEGGAGQGAGGQVLPIITGGITTSQRVTTVASSDATTTFTSEGNITASFAVIYSATTNKLISCVSFGESVSSVSGAFALNWANLGDLVTFTVAE